VNVFGVNSVSPGQQAGLIVVRHLIGIDPDRHLEVSRDVTIEEETAGEIVFPTITHGRDGQQAVAADVGIATCAPEPAGGTYGDAGTGFTPSRGL